MLGKRTLPRDHPAFAELPVRTVTVGSGSSRLAVHCAGALGSDRTPLVCVPGYQRNMADFIEFRRLFARSAGADWPLVLIDLQGRGRSTDRRDKAAYGTPNDASDVAEVVTALGIAKAVFLGQGYGGQVLMAMAAQHPSAMAATILIDAGPVTSTRGLVLLRNKLDHLHSLRGVTQTLAAFRQVLLSDYPGLSEEQVRRLSLRTHFIGRRGDARPLFDRHLHKVLEHYSLDDVLTAQWPLFAALLHAPLLMFRTQLTDQLLRETFDEMVRRRPDADAIVIAGQGSPALLDNPDDVDAIVRFVADVDRSMR
jgi:pimeloyl-ACP methyl ester carboxylesterase